MYQFIESKLNSKSIVILDGGTGTEIQRHGVPMDNETWCAQANKTHPDVVKLVHESYINAGSIVITANTFATSPLLFNSLGRDNELFELDRLAVEIAKDAVAGRQIAIGGSISTMRPVIAGSDRNDMSKEWTELEATRLFQLKANNLKDCGVDFLMLELLRDCDYAIWASKAAIETNLPVWIGISAEKTKDNKLVGYSRPDCLFEDIVIKIVELKPAVINVMHTSPNITDEALQIVRKYWNCPVGTYPESGSFKMPDWVFQDVILPEELVKKSIEWKEQSDVTLFGGCCGIGPDHIKELKNALL
jgi:S-methylmethionine-dependent homocysteine/selenocysteine methylase